MYEGKLNARLISWIAALFGACIFSSAAAGGEADYNRYCKACHPLEPNVNRVGPSLHAIVGRKAGGLTSYGNYSESYRAAGRAGLVWNQETLREYLKDPREFMRKVTGDPGAKSKMTFRVTNDKMIKAIVSGYILKMGEE